MFTTVLTRAAHLLLSRAHQYIPSPRNIQFLVEPFNIILPSMPRMSKGILSLTISHHNSVYTFLLHRNNYMPPPLLPHLSWFGQTNKDWQEELVWSTSEHRTQSCGYIEILTNLYFIGRSKSKFLVNILFYRSCKCSPVFMWNQNYDGLQATCRGKYFYTKGKVWGKGFRYKIKTNFLIRSVEFVFNFHLFHPAVNIISKFETINHSSLFYYLFIYLLRRLVSAVPPSSGLSKRYTIKQHRAIVLLGSRAL
jgi:hypothetical protein